VLARFGHTLEQGRVATATISANVERVRHWWQYSGGDPFDQSSATRDRIEAFVVDTSAGRLAAARSVVATLRRFYRFAIAYGLTDSNPAAGVHFTTRAALTRREAAWPALEDWAMAMRRRGLADGTIQKRVALARDWWGFCGDPFAAGVDWRTVNRFLDQSDQRAPNTRYATISHLHMFYTWARREQLVDHDPTELVERPKTTLHLPRPIHERDLAIAVALATPTMRAALLLAAGCGLRCIEITRLRWDDITVDTIRVRGKGNKSRVIPLHPAARDALEHVDRQRQHVFTWRWARNTPTARYAEGQLTSRAINDYLRSVGVGATAHQLRHYAATEALRSSHDLRAVQELLGHASPTTTSIYTKILVEHLVDVVAGIRLPTFDTPEPDLTAPATLFDLAVEAPVDCCGQREIDSISCDDRRPCGQRSPTSTASTSTTAPCVASRR